MTPEPIKALAELRALSDAATPGLWRRLITARTVQVTAGDRPVAKFARLADAAFIPALVNAFRADPAALLSLVPRDELAAALLETKWWLHCHSQTQNEWTSGELADAILAILNQDTGSAEPEPESTMDTTAELEAAWGIIANAGGGNWTTETPEWQDAAARWRDRVMPELSAELAERAPEVVGSAEPGEGPRMLGGEKGNRPPPPPPSDRA